MSEIVKYYSYRLFARPNFLEGLGRIFDFHNNFEHYNYSKDEAAADREALLADWLAVGQDMRSALEKYEKSITDTE